MAAGTSSMCLSTVLGRLEYMKLSMKDLPQEATDEYDLSSKAGASGWCYCEVRKAICGLKQAGYLAFKQLEKNLNAKGYYQSKLTPGLWLHKARNISFTLVVDDFGVCYKHKADAEHLAKALEEHYPAKAGWKGGKHAGAGLGWGYGSKAPAAPAKGCAKKALLQPKHGSPAKPCRSPPKHEPPKHGKKAQVAPLGLPAPMAAAEATYLQQACGKFLCYARAADGAMLHSLNGLASMQSNGAQQAMQAMLRFLSYAAAHPGAEKAYKASGMALAASSDAACLAAPQARSQAGGFHCSSCCFLCSKS